MNPKISAYIGFSVRKGAVVFGLDTIEMYRKKVHLILCSDTLAENSLKKACAEGEKRNCTVATLAGLEETLKRNCKVLAICDKQLAEAIKENLL